MLYFEKYVQFKIPTKREYILNDYYIILWLCNVLY